jgi:selenide,water dikinase
MQTSDDAGVYLHNGRALVATADFITPVCDDPRRFGRVAAANALSDVYAMGARPLFALNLCCFPENVPEEVLHAILEGAATTLGECGAALVGGHSVRDKDLKYGLAAVGDVDPEKLLTNAGARPGDRLILTKPLGTGVIINAFKTDAIDAEGLEPALKEMERLNAQAAELAVEHRAHAATDVTGFGLAGHALEMALASEKEFRIRFDRLPVLEGFHHLISKGVTTGSTQPNQAFVAPHFVDRIGLKPERAELLFDPQTSGGLLISVPMEGAEALLAELIKRGHTAAEIGDVRDGAARVEVV